MIIAKNIGELKKLIADLPDEMKLVTPGSDHSYDTASASVQQAEVKYSKGGRIDYMWEYYDEGNRSYKTTKIEEVLVIGG